MGDAMVLLVNGAHGIYAWHSLANCYHLYIDGKDGLQTLSEWMKGRGDFDNETIETVFHPDNEYWCENIDYLDRTGLQVKMEGKEMYWNTFQSSDGDIWAVHPDSTWNEDEEAFTL